MDETNLQDASPAEGESVLPDSNAPADTPAAENVDSASTTPESPQARSGVQKRIDELTRERHDAARERDYWREQAMRAAKAEPPKPVEKPAELSLPPMPTLESAGWDEAKYRDDMGKYNAAQAEYLSRLAEDRAKAQFEAWQKTEAQRRLETSFRQREAEFEARTPDYRSVAYAPDVPLSAEMAEVIAQSAEGPALAYYLAKHRDKAAEIARLPERLAAYELGRIEATLAKPAAAPVQRVSQAPPPPPKIDSGADVATDKDDDPDSMSVDEWMRRENKRDSKRRESFFKPKR